MFKTRFFVACKATRVVAFSGVLGAAFSIAPSALAAPLASQSTPPLALPPAVASQARVLLFLEGFCGRVEPISPQDHEWRAALSPADQNAYVFRRAKAAFAGDNVNTTALAVMLHQELQFCRWAFESRQTARVRAGMQVAGVAGLYLPLLERDPQKGDPRIGALFHQGFLLPGKDYISPEASRVVYEGAATAFGRAGQGQWQEWMLEHLVDKVAGTPAQRDGARVHLSDVLARQGLSLSASLPDEKNDATLRGRELGLLRLELRQAIGLLNGSIVRLDAVKSTDLAGARRPLSERVALRDALARRLAALPLDTEGGETVGPGERTPRGGGNGGDNGNGGNGGAPAPWPVLPPLGGLGGAMNFGPQLGAGGAGAPGERLARGEGAEAQEKDEPKSAMQLALEAAQEANELARQASEAATVALAHLLDASGGQPFWEAAQSRATAANTTNTRATNPQRATAPTATELARLEKAAYEAKTQASRSGERASRLQARAGEAAQRAARLALLTHSTGQEQGGQEQGERDKEQVDGAAAPAALAPEVDAP